MYRFSSAVRQFLPLGHNLDQPRDDALDALTRTPPTKREHRQPTPNMESAVCCITLELMRDPVMAADGHTYERDALLRWLKTSNVSPATGAQLANRMVMPNYCVKMLIQERDSSVTLWRCWHFCWWMLQTLSHLPEALGRAGLAVLLYIHIGDAPALRLWSSLLLEGPVHVSDAASLAALATLCGGLFFSMSVLAAKGATKVVSSVLLCVCCFSCGLMAAPLGPIDEIVAVSRLLLLSGFGFCCLAIYLMGSAEPAQAADEQTLHELAAPSEPDPAAPARAAPARGGLARDAPALIAPARAVPAPVGAPARDAPAPDAPAGDTPAPAAPVRAAGMRADFAQLHAGVVKRCMAYRQLHAEALHVTRRLTVRVRARSSEC